GDSGQTLSADLFSAIQATTVAVLGLDPLLAILMQDLVNGGGDSPVAHGLGGVSVAKAPARIASLGGLGVPLARPVRAQFETRAGIRLISRYRKRSGAPNRRAHRRDASLWSQACAGRSSPGTAAGRADLSRRPQRRRQDHPPQADQPGDPADPGRGLG